MTIDPVSVGIGIAICAFIAGGWQLGWQAAVRHHRRIVRHGKNLDLVYYEDAIRDDSIEREPHGQPEPVSRPAFHRQSDR